MDFCKKNLLNLIKNRRENYTYQLVKTFLNSMRKWRRKSRDLINKKPLKFDEKIKKKINHLLLYKR